MAIDVLTADELAELLRISPSRVLLLARRGDVPFFRIDGRIRFDAEDIESWIKAQRQAVFMPKPRVVNPND